MKPETYKTMFTCKNCWRDSYPDIPKGELRPGAVRCPFCGCMTDGTEPAEEPTQALESEWVLEHCGRDQVWESSVYHIDDLELDVRRAILYGFREQWPSSLYRWRNTVNGRIGRLEDRKYIEDVPTDPVEKKFEVTYKQVQYAHKTIVAVNENEARKSVGEESLDGTWDITIAPHIIEVREVL